MICKYAKKFQKEILSSLCAEYRVFILECQFLLPKREFSLENFSFLAAEFFVSSQQVFNFSLGSFLLLASFQFLTHVAGESISLSSCQLNPASEKLKTR